MISAATSTRSPNIRRDISKFTLCEVSGKNDLTWTIKEEVGIIRLIPIYQSLWWHMGGRPDIVDIIGGATASRYDHALMASVNGQHLPPCLDMDSLAKTINQSVENA